MSRVALPVPVYVSRDVEPGGFAWEAVCSSPAFVWVTKETGRASGRHGWRILSRHFAIYRVTHSGGRVRMFLVTRRASAASAIAFARDVAVDSEFWK